MKKALQWHLFRRWSKCVRVAIQRCLADKGYLTERDWVEIRAGDHWALRSNVRTVPIEILRQTRTQPTNIVPVFWQ